MLSRVRSQSKGIKGADMAAIRRIFSILMIFLALPALAQVKPRLGVSIPLSGEAGATYGTDMRNFFLFANEKLTGNRYELIFEDDKCSGKEAVTAAQKFIHIDRVSAVIGFACSGATLSAAPLYEKSKVFTLVTFASSPKIAEAGDYIFRTFPSDWDAARLLYEHSLAHYRKIAVLSELGDYAQDLKNSLVAWNKDARLEIMTEDYMPQTTDFRTLLLKLKSQNPQAIFINSQTEAGFAVILKQLKALQPGLPVLGAYWPGSASLQQTAGNDLEGVAYVETPSLAEILTPEGNTLYQEYLKKFGPIRSTEALFATSFEGLRALDQGLRSGQELRKYFYNTAFNGIFGPFSFDNRGEIKGITLVLKKIINGKAATFPRLPM